MNSAAVRENQPAVCALHEGITRGLLDELNPRARLAAFVPHDPDDAGCLIESAASRRRSRRDERSTGARRSRGLDGRD